MENAWKQFVDFVIGHWQLVFIVATCLILVIISIIFFSVAKRQDYEFDHKIAEQSNSVRVYVVDVPNDTVTYFNVTDLKRVVKIRLGDFYRRFSPNKQNRVMEWIAQIIDPKVNYDPYLETSIMVGKGKKPYFSMLEVDHVNHKDGRVFLLSYLLTYINPDKRAVYRGTTPMNEVVKMISAGNRNVGCTLCFRFDYKKGADAGKQINPLVYGQLKGVFAPFLSKKSYMIDLSPNEIVFVDLRYKEAQQGIFVGKSILNAIKRFFSLNSLTGAISVRIGLVMHSSFPLQGETIISKCSQFAASLDSEDDKQAVYVYSESDKKVSRSGQFTSRTEVEKIIEDRKLSYQFRPIYSVDKERVIGYSSKVNIDSQYFDNINELKDYALKTQDDRELFATIAKNIVPKFANEKTLVSQKLFFPVKMSERSYMLKIFAYIKAKDQHIVFMYDESDIKANYNPDHLEDFVGDMRSIKTKGYEVGILVDQNDLGLPSQIYSCFDYFMVTFASAGSQTGSDTRLRAQMHALVERLLKYEKPIIASDIDGWNAIELLIRSGLNYISSDYFAPYDEMLLPVPPKSQKRIHETIIKR
ncbi:MAG: hypothetical protein MJ239_02605 [Bacilli bacterium]|nr:hypothetical protein [Bacilli bacterium]